jgi:hypothetical protein
MRAKIEAALMPPLAKKSPVNRACKESEISLFSIYPDLSGFYWRKKKLLFVWTVWTLWTI